MEKNDTRLREHLANERTFLAWVRTSVALIGLGFVIVKFALFLKQVSLLFQENPIDISQGFSAITGVIIVAFGVILAPFAYFQYKAMEKQINKQTYKSSSILILFLIFIIVFGGVLLVFHLISNISL